MIATPPALPGRLVTRERVEHHQVWVYAAATASGLAVGTVAPAVGRFLEPLLWPVLGTLLYVTFTQIPLTHLPEAFRDVRFIGAVLAGNFLLVPLLVSALLTLLPDAPVVRLGVLLVLLAPCTDWFVTFTHLGGGDARRALAVTPVNLLAQLALLPFLLWLFMGRTFAEIFAADRIVRVFGTLIVLPLAAAYLTERAAQGRPGRQAMVSRLGSLPVPLLGLVVFLIATSQVQVVVGSLGVLGRVGAVFVIYLVAAAGLGVAAARALNLPPASGRTLVFTLGTRNSFVVLPFAFALPGSWELAAVVIVLQSLVELWGMAIYVWAVPRLLLPIDR